MMMKMMGVSSRRWICMEKGIVGRKFYMEGVGDPHDRIYRYHRYRIVM